MADRPILFSAPMVRALIAGRKTQTRRILNPQPVCGYAGDTPYFSWNGYTGLWPDDWQTAIERNVRIAVGDRLWVRESVTRFDKGTCDQNVWYRAGHNTDEFYQGYLAQMAGSPDGEWPLDVGPAGGAPYKVPSIHMPRWASRLTLPVSGVKVERLQDISEADAIAEGVEVASTDPDWPGYRDYGNDDKVMNPTAKGSYRTLWDHINGAGSWAANPWVAAYTFDAIKRNIDQIEQVAA